MEDELRKTIRFYKIIVCVCGFNTKIWCEIDCFTLNFGKNSIKLYNEL